MSSAIVGFDVGSFSCYASVAKAGGIETILNEYSERCTSSCINFSKKSRSIGLAANLQLIDDYKNTINNFTNLVGKKFSDTIQNELPNYHYKICEDKNDVRIEVSYLGSNHKFKPEQLLAMLITKLKNLAENNLKITITQAVLNVPLFYTNTERMCLISALNIAGIECLCLINDLSAVGLLYHSMRAKSISTSKIVAFVDIGYSNFQAVIIQFMEKKFCVLQVGYDTNLGGREFDKVIYKYLSRHFAKQYSVDVSKSIKAELRLMVECEKIKKRLSANPAEFVANIECLMNDKDVSAKIDRSLFEKLCESLLNRMKSVIEMMLQQYRTNNKEPITSVEIIGGTSRIPCVKQVITKAFEMELQTTLNADEAVSRGCAIQSAIMNANCKIRRIKFSDFVPFDITIDTFKDVQMSDFIKFDIQQKECYRLKSVTIDFRNHYYPLTGEVELMFDGCSIIEFRYTDRNEAPSNNTVIGYITINHENGTFENNCKMVLEYTINKCGIFFMKSLVIKSPKPTNKRISKYNSLNADDTFPLDFQVICDRSISSYTLEEFRNKENEFILKDLEETERLNVKYRLEESIYKCRNFLSNLSQNENEKLLNHLNGIETWLFDEGENEQKEKYCEHLRTIEYIIKIVQKKTDSNQNKSNPVEELSCTVKNPISGYGQVKVPVDNDSNRNQNRDNSRSRDHLSHGCDPRVEYNLGNKTNFNIQNEYPDPKCPGANSANNPISGYGQVKVPVDNDSNRNQNRDNPRSRDHLSRSYDPRLEYNLGNETNFNIQNEYPDPKCPGANSANLSKNHSKSINACNNPKVKEPKNEDSWL